ncbi:hypothetical protein L1049_025986 [Liquidambar formosana]|uniref:F-box domain-containing protein n=1 Tax=Liquidambar formosana TaxID=63359 RepID=A0AAP0NBW9_LIQFO
MSVDWSQLPPELLETIAKKLKIYVDYLRFRAVCHNWRSSVLKTPNHLPCQIPWLFLPQPHSHQTHKLHRRRAFFSLSENKFHFLNLPEPSHCKRLCGSSHGWLVILDETPTISLINAITDAKLYLPPLSTFPNVSDLNFSKIGREYTLRTFTGDLVTHNLREMRDVFIKKVVLSSSPSNGRRFYCRSDTASDRLNSSGPRWEKVESLGDGALFLGQNSSLCLVSVGFSGM